jgi:SNF2 family N-terminal domain.
VAHDDYLIRHAVTYLALLAEPSLKDILDPTKPRAEVEAWTDERIRKIESGEVDAEIPPGGREALMVQNYGAPYGSRERIMEVFLGAYDYDGVTYVNTSGAEVMHEDYDPLSLIVFDSEDLFSIYADSFPTGDPSLGLRGNPPLQGPLSRLNPSALTGASITGHQSQPRSNESTATGSEMPDSPDASPEPRPKQGPNLGRARENVERLEDRLRRMNPSGEARGDGAPHAPGDGAGSGPRENRPPSAYSEDNLLELLATFKETKSNILGVYEKLVEKNDREQVDQIISLLNTVGTEYIPEFADYIGVDLEPNRQAIDVELEVEPPEIETEDEGGAEDEPEPGTVPDEPNFGFPEGSFDDRFYLSADDPDGYLAVRAASAEDYLGGYIENPDMTARVSKGITEALEAGDLGITVLSWQSKGGRADISIGEPFDLDLHLIYSGGFDASIGETSYRMEVVDQGTTFAFAEFLYEIARTMAPSIQEVDELDAQFRIADIASNLSFANEEQVVPDDYVRPKGQGQKILARPNEPQSGMTVTGRQKGIFPTQDDDSPFLPDEHFDRAEERARQTGVKTAFFIAHGVSGYGQPQEVSRIVAAEKDFITSERQPVDTGSYSIIHSTNPQTISEVGAQRSDRRVSTDRGSRAEIRSVLAQKSDKDRYRVVPNQEYDDETGDLDTFFSWLEVKRPEGAQDAGEAGDLTIPEGALVREAGEEDVRTYTVADIGGSEYDGIQEDMDLTGKEPLEMTDSERRENNSKAVEIITSKEPSQITQSDREVLRKYTGAGGLGMETGTGSIRGERTEHYTDYEIVEAMWEAMDNIGQEGNFLEPGAGIGNVAGLRPDDNSGFMVMVENSTTTADILETLYPNQQTLHRSLASVNLDTYQLQGAIGNVPFANSQIHQSDDPVTQGLSEEPNIHDYFILRSLNAVEPGGIVMLITSTTTADRQSAELRRAMIRGAGDPGHPTSDHRAAFLGGLRLPSETFEKSASTSVSTDLLVFQKLPDGSELDALPGEVYEATYDFMSAPETRRGVLKPDRSQGSDEAKETIEKIEDLRERRSEMRKRKERLTSERKNKQQEKYSTSQFSEEEKYNRLVSEINDLRSEINGLRDRISDLDDEISGLESKFEDMEEQQVEAGVNAYFDNRPGRVIGDLKFGYKRQSIENFGVDGSIDEAVDAISSFNPPLARGTAQEKELFRQGTGEQLGIERKHPDGAIVYRDGQFYESQPVGYSPVEVEDEIEDKARSAVAILETYEALTYALAREAKQIVSVRKALKAKLKSHNRRFGLPGEDEDLMNNVFRYDPRRATLGLLIDENEVGVVQFADVIDYDEFYANDQYRAEINDDENLEGIAQFVRAQGEEQSAETYARFYKGGELDISEMQEILQESDDFYFVPKVGPIVVDQLSEEIYDRIAEQIDLNEEESRNDQIEDAIAQAYIDGDGGYIHDLFFTSGELYRRMDLIDLLIEEVEEEDTEQNLRSIKREIDESLPEPKAYWDIDLDPRHYRSWLPLKYVEMFINDRDYLGYDAEMEWVDTAEDPDDRGLILRYRNNGVYVGGITDDNFSDWDYANGWHGIPYSNILKRYLKFGSFPIKYGGDYYVEPGRQGEEPTILDGTDEYLYGAVESRDDAYEHPIEDLYIKNKEIQTQNERQMRETIPQDFQEWADSAPQEVRDGIKEAYNRTYRSRKLPDFDGSTLNLPGFNFPLPIFEHNQRAAEKLVFNQGGGDNHSVGAGKTFASIIAIETLRSRGLINKPMYVVPTQVIEKWMAEYQELFPEARILVLRGRSEGLEEEVLRAQLFDYDAIFTTIPGFKGLQLSPEVRRQKIQDRIDLHAEQAQQIQEDLEEDYPQSVYGPFLGGSGEGSYSGNGIMDTIEEYEDELQQISEEQAEEQVDTAYLDEIGVDSFIFDEAHAYKNALTPSALAAEIGIAKNDPSSRAEDAKTKVDWLHWTLGEDKNSFILTATPLENNPLEVWHMLNLCGPSVLERYGIESLDAFIDLYVEVKTRMEQSVDGQFSASEVVTGFRNVREMRRVIDERLDIMSYEELINFYTDPQPEGLGMNEDEIPFGRPDKVVNEQILEPSELHEVLLEDIRQRSAIIRAALGQGDKITDNFLSLTTDGGKMAEDLRLYQPAFWGYEGPGLKVDNIAEQSRRVQQEGAPPRQKRGPDLPAGGPYARHAPRYAGVLSCARRTTGHRRPGDHRRGQGVQPASTTAEPPCRDRPVRRCHRPGPRGRRA